MLYYYIPSTGFGLVGGSTGWAMDCIGLRVIFGFSMSTPSHTF